MKLAWLTDIHLNFLEQDVRQEFYLEIIKTNCDAILITGDIAEAPSLCEILKEMADNINRPIYFILGNHDYYRGEISKVRATLTSFANSNKQLFWLPAAGIQQLNNNTILVGQDGWADGRFGDYQNSTVSLNDSRLIAELFQARILGKSQLLEKMQSLADHDAMQLRENLIAAINCNPKKIIVLTHVPPFKESCMHEGNLTDKNYLPYFSSKVIGDVLLQIAKQNPSIDFLVRCGHTHSASYYQPLDNMVVKAGAAQYYNPQVQEVIL